jgi:hypothetical protein
MVIGMKRIWVEEADEFVDGAGPNPDDCYLLSSDSLEDVLSDVFCKYLSENKIHKRGRCGAMARLAVEVVET